MSLVLESLKVMTRLDLAVGAAAAAVETAAAGTSIMTVDTNGLVMASGYPIKVGSNRFMDKAFVNEILLAASVDKHAWICYEGRWQLEAVRAILTVAGSDAGAVTLDIMVCTGTQAPASGTTQLTATMDMKTTANTLISPALIATPTTIVPGNRVSLDFTGTLTALVGICTMVLKRID